LASVLSGVVAGALLVALVLLGQTINLRAMFISASPELFVYLTFGQGVPRGLALLVLVGGLIGAVSAAINLIPARFRGALIQALMWVALIGLLRDLILTVVAQWVIKANAFPGQAALAASTAPEWAGRLYTSLADWARDAIIAIEAFLEQRVFAGSGLRPLSSVILVVVLGALRFWRAGRVKVARIPAPGHQRQQFRRVLLFGAIALVFVLLPPVLGIFFAEILDNVGLFILMGLGLNIVVGFAGLLDLGYVAFYAIGAYTMGVFTSPELGFFNLSYWQALPFALIASLLAGFVLGLPVLKMRGDYLAIVTLGFGEIVRLLALSDWLRPWLGGTQGIQRIAQPTIGELVLNSQQELYYVFLAGIAIVAFVAWRLKESKLGRAWMALREDEDVAKAMGINHVTTKLMAFATGALFSGLAGTIFAAKLQSVYPHSMNFLVSINVLCLIIIGGMGSIPGVFVGALALIAAPDLLREFAEYRYLVYGAVLVAMMLTRPEGLWPEARRRLELHEAEVEAGAEVIEPAPVASRVAEETTS
jgi:branched-chain amino acid transport system permease protein